MDKRATNQGGKAKKNPLGKERWNPGTCFECNLSEKAGLDSYLILIIPVHDFNSKFNSEQAINSKQRRTSEGKSSKQQSLPADSKVTRFIIWFYFFIFIVGEGFLNISNFDTYTQVILSLFYLPKGGTNVSPPEII